MKRALPLLMLATPLLCAVIVAIAQTGGFGRFEGPIQVEWLNGPPESERRMRLLHDVTYVDANGKKWTAPSGFETDGASIPQAFWSVVGGPFDGQYRNAAVVHDRYCVTKTEPWQAVHKMFYSACRASGVSEVKAKILYAAVLAGGPRWTKCRTCAVGFGPEKDEREQPLTRPPISETQAKELAGWVEQNDPPLQDIEKHVQSRYPSVPLMK